MVCNMVVFGYRDIVQCIMLNADLGTCNALARVSKTCAEAAKLAHSIEMKVERHGDIKTIIPFIKGTSKPHGFCRIWRDGILMVQFCCINGQINGRYREWWPNGQRRFEYRCVQSSYCYRHLLKAIVSRLALGDIIAVHLRRIYISCGERRLVRINGLVRRFHQNGRVATCCRMINNQRRGVKYIYDCDGVLVRKVTYIGGHRWGLHELWWTTNGRSYYAADMPAGRDSAFIEHTTIRSLSCDGALYNDSEENQDNLWLCFIGLIMKHRGRPRQN